MEIIWPEIFDNPSLVDTREDAGLCADGLCAWSNCFMQKQPPDNFGEVLAKIGARLKCSPLPEALMEASKRFLPDKL